MDTDIYSNWTAKASECGFTNEEQCGLALLFALRLVQRYSEDEEQDIASYWLFMSESKFSELRSQLEIPDLGPLIQLLNMVPKFLGVSLPRRRTTSTGEPATIFDDGKNTESTDGPVETLRGRHFFDVLWCASVGNSLRDEVRTPAHAYVLASLLTDYLSVLDPTAYALISRALTENLSPFAACFTSKEFIRNTNAFFGYEPFQLCLSFFLPGDDFAEGLWGIQRILFYQQPGGNPVNTSKQYLDNYSFAKYSAPLLAEHIVKNRDSYLRLSANVSSEYIAQGPTAEALPDKLLDAMSRVYGFTTDDMESEKKHLRLLMNVAVFYTVACYFLKNSFNRREELPGLTGYGDVGFMWQFPKGRLLLSDAKCVFDVMLSWWPGLCYCLGIETVEGLGKWFYIGQEVDDSTVDELFSLVVLAYAPAEIILCYTSDTLRFTDSPTESPIKAIFRPLNREDKDILIFHNVERQMQQHLCLGELLGHTENVSVAGGRLAKSVTTFGEYANEESRLVAKRKLVDRFGDPGFWGFELLAS